ncbi:MAG: glycoside hydrolase [Chitinophagaceae bacterium]|nr:glycoside hydrolase [Oligoflexus sp.]
MRNKTIEICTVLALITGCSDNAPNRTPPVSEKTDSDNSQGNPPPSSVPTTPETATTAATPPSSSSGSTSGANTTSTTISTTKFGGGDAVQKVIAFLKSTTGKNTVTGQHNKEPNASPAKWTDQVQATTGHFPGLWSGDFLFADADIKNRQVMIDQAKKQWSNGALINLMWHACPPTGAVSCNWEGGPVSHLSDADWKDLTTDGGRLNKVWKERMDAVAVYMQQLKDAGVAPMFRPFHEMNQGIFWWAGRTGSDGTAKLYELTHDYMVKTKGLTNIVWIWDVQDISQGARSWEDIWKDYKPRADTWDVMAIDIYDGSGYSADKYKAAQSVSNGKPIAVGECQVLPSDSILAQQPKWTFFMGWSELTFTKNSDAEIKATYNSDHVLTRDKMPGWN